MNYINRFIIYIIVFLINIYMNEHITNYPLFIVKTEMNYEDYTFLTNINNKDFYYEIINSLNDYQLKSLYDFIFKHYIKCKKLLNEDNILNPFSHKKDINDNLKDFINDDIVKEIFIINLIRAYFR